MTAWYFDPEADDFDARKQELLDEFTAWAGNRGGNADLDEQRSDAGLFIDWRASYSTKDLGRLATQDLDEFLLSWCPAKYSAPPDVARPLCASLGVFIEFLSATGKLSGGAGTAAKLIAHVSSLPDQVEAAMADETKFGMAKSLFAGSGFSDLADASSTEDMESLLQQRMDEHNALPIEQRRAATDHLFRPEPVELPFVYVPPAAPEVEESASAAPVMATFDALRHYLGETGRTLTQRGNIKLADARALIDLLGTGDEMDAEIGGRVFKTQSSQDLPELSQIVDWAIGVGAVRRERGRLLPVKRWQKRAATDRAEQIWRHLVDTGPLSGGDANMSPVGQYRLVLEDGIPHWLLPLLPDGHTANFDEVVELARGVIDEQFGDLEEWWARALVDLVDHDLGRIFESIEQAGVIRWDGWHQVTDRYATEHREGGTVQLTAVGRHVVSQMADEAGYRLQTVPDMSEATAAQLFEYLRTNSIDPSEALHHWRPAETTDRRGALITEVLAGDTSAHDRLLGFDLLEALGPETVAPGVRQLLDSPSAGHAALFLITHDLGDQDELSSFVDIGPLVDTLSYSADLPDELAQLWSKTTESGNDPDDLLYSIWHHPAPETAVVLEGLGKALPDKRQAKAARKALIQHRTWMANHD